MGQVRSRSSFAFDLAGIESGPKFNPFTLENWAMPLLGWRMPLRFEFVLCYMSILIILSFLILWSRLSNLAGAWLILSWSHIARFNLWISTLGMIRSRLGWVWFRVWVTETNLDLIFEMVYNINWGSVHIRCTSMMHDSLSLSLTPKEVHASPPPSPPPIEFHPSW